MASSTSTCAFNVRLPAELVKAIDAFMVEKQREMQADPEGGLHNLATLSRNTTIAWLIGKGLSEAKRESREVPGAAAKPSKPAARRPRKTGRGAAAGSAG
jgi:hypothetical protein